MRQKQEGKRILSNNDFSPSFNKFPNFVTHFTGVKSSALFFPNEIEKSMSIPPHIGTKKKGLFEIRDSPIYEDTMSFFLREEKNICIYILEKSHSTSIW